MLLDRIANLHLINVSFSEKFSTINTKTFVLNIHVF